MESVELPEIFPSMSSEHRHLLQKFGELLQENNKNKLKPFSISQTIISALAIVLLVVVLALVFEVWALVKDLSNILNDALDAENCVDKDGNPYHPTTNTGKIIYDIMCPSGALFPLTSVGSVFESVIKIDNMLRELVPGYN